MQLSFLFSPSVLISAARIQMKRLGAFPWRNVTASFSPVCLSTGGGAGRAGRSLWMPGRGQEASGCQPSGEEGASSSTSQLLTHALLQPHAGGVTFLLTAAKRSDHWLNHWGNCGNGESGDVFLVKIILNSFLASS